MSKNLRNAGLSTWWHMDIMDISRSQKINDDFGLTVSLQLVQIARAELMLVKPPVYAASPIILQPWDRMPRAFALLNTHVNFIALGLSWG